VPSRNVSRVPKSGLPGFGKKLCKNKKSQAGIRWAAKERLLSWALFVNIYEIGESAAIAA
jgi:hypothetical protein